MTPLPRLLFLTLCLGGLPTNISPKKEAGFNLFEIQFSLSRDEAIYKDSISFSVDDRALSVDRWKASVEPVEEYVPSLKLHKKLYRGSFSIKVFFSQTEFESIGEESFVYFSCFLIIEDEKIVPYFLKFPIKRQGALVVAKDQIRQKKSLSLSVKSTDRPIVMFHGRFWLTIFLLLLFIGFLFVDVFFAKDLTAIFIVSLWLLFARLFIPYTIVLLVASLAFLLLSVSYFSESGRNAGLQRFVRVSLGLLCGASVLPLVAEALLSLM